MHLSFVMRYRCHQQSSQISARYASTAVMAMILALSWLTALAQAQEPFSVQPADRQPLSGLPPQWKAMLDPGGVKLQTSVNGLSVNVVEIWWSKAVSVREKAATELGVNYSELKPGAVLGVLHFGADTPEDFREDSYDQKLAPGFYSLRYAQLEMEQTDRRSPPAREFVLLSRLDSDSRPEQTLSIDELLKLSRKASHSSRPAAIRLVASNPAYKQLPAVIQADTGECVLQLRVPRANRGQKQPRDFPLALVVVTPRDESGGS